MYSFEDIFINQAFGNLTLNRLRNNVYREWEETWKRDDNSARLAF